MDKGRGKKRKKSQSHDMSDSTRNEISLQKLRETFGNPRPITKYRGIAFSAPRSSGKSTLARTIAKCVQNPLILSLAEKLKKICIDGYGMDADPQKKDVELLQRVGDAMRSIDEDVFINFLMKKVEKQPESFVICDDARRLNELKRFKKEGFLLVRLATEEDIRKTRAKKLYPHMDLSSNQHACETEMCSQEAQQYYDLVLKNDVLQDLFTNIVKIFEIISPQ
jgi:hypothetical protein